MYAKSNYEDYVVKALRSPNSGFTRYNLRKTSARGIGKRLAKLMADLPSERAYVLMDSFGYSLLRARNYDAAADVFEYAVEKYTAPDTETSLRTRTQRAYCLNRSRDYTKALK